MNFKSIPYVQRYEELIEIAFGRAAKEAPDKKIKTVSKIVGRHLLKVSRGWPNLDELPLFYYKLVDVVVGVGKIKKALGAVNWASGVLEKLARSYDRRIRAAGDREAAYKLRKEYYGRVASVLKHIKDELSFLAEARKKLLDFPDVEDTFTVVIAGLPNVGKSSMLRALTRAKPKVESYPYTTQSILLGYFEARYRRYQVVDTPGLLDRAIEDRNPIEKQAVLALRYLADVVLYLFDPSHSCGYPVEDQLNVYREITENFDVPVIAVVNKVDLLGEEEGRRFLAHHGLKGVLCSAKDNSGIEELKGRLIMLSSSSGAE
jgi:nucleolar GTP-binding protein